MIVIVIIIIIIMTIMIIKIYLPMYMHVWDCEGESMKGYICYNVSINCWVNKLLVWQKTIVCVILIVMPSQVTGPRVDIDSPSASSPSVFFDSHTLTDTTQLALKLLSSWIMSSPHHQFSQSKVKVSLSLWLVSTPKFSFLFKTTLESCCYFL